MIGLGHQRFPGVRRTEGQDQGGEKTLQRNRELLQTEVNSEPYPQVSVSPVCDKAAVSDFAALTLTVFTLFTSNISPNKKVHRCSLPRKDGVVYIIYPLNNVYSISSLFNT